jgi:hypothetical protein
MSPGHPSSNGKDHVRRAAESPRTSCVTAEEELLDLQEGVSWGLTEAPFISGALSGQALTQGTLTERLHYRNRLREASAPQRQALGKTASW